MQSISLASRKLGARVIVGAMTAASILPAMAADPTTPEAGIADALAKILLIVAAAGGAYITISLGSVGWSVGAKFIKRLGGKA